MRWFRRLACAALLSTLFASLLTWAAWPRPRTVCDIDGGGVSIAFYPWFDQAGAPYRLIQRREPVGVLGTAFWFLAEDGTLAGPWRPARPRESFGFDAAGRLLAGTVTAEISLDPPDAVGYAFDRYDPATGREEVLVSLPGPPPEAVRVSADKSALAVPTTSPLAFAVYDLADGRPRARLAFPGRVGGLDKRKAALAAFNWELSPDGRELALAEAWGGAERLTPPGIEVYEVATGRLARRLTPRFPPPPPAAGQSADFGVGWFEFPDDGRSVNLNRERRRFDPVRQQWSSDLSEPMPRCYAATGELLAGESADAPPGWRAASHGGRSLWLCRLPRWRYRVTHEAGATVADWRPLPGRLGDPQNDFIGPYLVPGHPAVVYLINEPNRPGLRPWLSWLTLGLLGGVGPAPSRNAYVYHDWSTGDFRRVTGEVNAGHAAVGPRDLAILTPTTTGVRLALWDLPPPGKPWAWSVPAGVALGVLVTAAGVGLRRRRVA